MQVATYYLSKIAASVRNKNILFPGVYTFMDNEVFPVFLWNQCIETVMAAQDISFSEMVLCGLDRVEHTLHMT